MQIKLNQIKLTNVNLTHLPSAALCDVTKSSNLSLVLLFSTQLPLSSTLFAETL